MFNAFAQITLLRDRLAELEREEEHHFQVAKRAFGHLAASRRRVAAVKKKIKALQARAQARRENQHALTIGHPSLRGDQP
ncbi:MAG: hypothetical protein ACYC3I_02865 [Gemmataceae bacterium]